jgi:hypothetical protein
MLDFTWTVIISPFVSSLTGFRTSNSSLFYQCVVPMGQLWSVADELLDKVNSPARNATLIARIHGQNKSH